MPRLLPVFSLLTLLFLALAHPAWASADTKGAAELKQIFQDMITERKSAHTIGGGELKTTGDIIIEPAGNYYAVTLPNMTIVDAEGNRAEVGMIAINAIPGDKQGQWKMSVAWPSPITYINKEGKPNLKIDIGAQRMAGLFDARIGNFIKLDSAYQTIRIESYKHDHITTIPKATLKYNLEEKEPGIFTGPITGTAEKIAVRDSAQNELLYIENGKFSMNIDSMAVVDNKAMQDEMNRLASRIQSAEGQASGEDAMAVMDMITTAFDSLGNGFTSQYDLDGLRLLLPDNKGTGKPEKVSIDNIGFGMDMTGFAQNNVKVGLRLGYEGFLMTPPTEEFLEFGPQTLKMDLSFNDIPFQELMEMASNSLETTIQNPAAADMVKIQAVMALPQLLTASGTNVSINKAIFESKASQAEVAGKIKADASAKTGATGFLTAKMYGLDELLNTAQQAALKDKEAGQKSNLSKIFPILVLLRGTAEQQTSPDGRVESNFRITLDEDGQLMINNTSIDALQSATQQ